MLWVCRNDFNKYDLFGNFITFPFLCDSLGLLRIRNLMQFRNQQISRKEFVETSFK